MATQLELDRLHAVVPAAQFCAKQWGVPASVTLAQWILESGWGTTALAVKANNCFGIKASHLAAPDTYEEFPTHEYVNGQRVLVEALFVKYASVADSFKGHALLLSRAARYQRAMRVADDPKAFAVYLQTCGYSTSPTYGATLGKLIDEYKLDAYDVHEPHDPALQKEAA